MFCCGIILPATLSESNSFFEVMGLTGLYVEGNKTTLMSYSFIVFAMLLVFISWKILLYIYCSKIKHIQKQLKILSFWKLTYNQMHGFIPLVMILKVFLCKPSILDSLIILFLLIFLIIFYFPKTEFPMIIYSCILLIIEIIIFALKYIFSLQSVYNAFIQQLTDFFMKIYIYPTELGLYIYTEEESQIQGIYSFRFLFFDVLICISLLYRINYMLNKKNVSTTLLPQIQRIDYIHNINNNTFYKFTFSFVTNLPKFLIFAVFVYISFNPSLLNFIIAIIICIHMYLDINLEHTPITVNKTRKMPYFTSRWNSIYKTLLFPLTVIAFLRYIVQYDGFIDNTDQNHNNILSFIGIIPYAKYYPDATTRDYLFFGSHYKEMVALLQNAVGFYLILTLLLLFQSTFLEYLINIHNLFTSESTVSNINMNTRKKRRFSLGAILYPLDEPDVFQYFDQLNNERKQQNKQYESVSEDNNGDDEEEHVYLWQLKDPNYQKNSSILQKSKSYVNNRFSLVSNQSMNSNSSTFSNTFISTASSHAMYLPMDSNSNSNTKTTFNTNNNQTLSRNENSNIHLSKMFLSPQPVSSQLYNIHEEDMNEDDSEIEKQTKDIHIHSNTINQNTNNDTLLSNSSQSLSKPNPNDLIAFTYTPPPPPSSSYEVIDENHENTSINGNNAIHNQENSNESNINNESDSIDNNNDDNNENNNSSQTPLPPPSFTYLPNQSMMFDNKSLYQVSTSSSSSSTNTNTNISEETNINQLDSYLYNVPQSPNNMNSTAISTTAIPDSSFDNSQIEPQEKRHLLNETVKPSFVQLPSVVDRVINNNNKDPINMNNKELPRKGSQPYARFQEIKSIDSLNNNNETKKSRAQSMMDSAIFIGGSSEFDGNKKRYNAINNFTNYIYKHTDIDIKEQSKQTFTTVFDIIKYFFMNFIDFIITNGDIILKFLYITLLLSMTGITNITSLFWFINLFITMFLPSNLLTAQINMGFCTFFFILQYLAFTMDLLHLSSITYSNVYYLLQTNNYPSLFCASMALILSALLLYIEYFNDCMCIHDKSNDIHILKKPFSSCFQKYHTQKKQKNTNLYNVPMSINSDDVHNSISTQANKTSNKNSIYSKDIESKNSLDTNRNSITPRRPVSNQYSNTLVTEIKKMNRYSKYILKLDNSIPVLRNNGLSHFLRGYLKNTKNNKIFKSLMTFICNNIHLITIIFLFIMSIQSYDIIHFIYFSYTLIFLITGTQIKSPKSVTFQTLKWFSYLALFFCSLYQLPLITPFSVCQTQNCLNWDDFIGLNKYQIIYSTNERLCQIDPSNGLLGYSLSCLDSYSFEAMLPIILINIMLYVQQIIQGSRFYINLKKEIEDKHSLIGERMLDYYISKWKLFSQSVNNIYPQMKQYLHYIREKVDKYPLTIQYDENSNLFAYFNVLNGYATRILLYNKDGSSYIPSKNESILLHIYEIITEKAVSRESIVRKVILPLYTIPNNEGLDVLHCTINGSQSNDNMETDSTNNIPQNTSASNEENKEMNSFLTFAMLTSLCPNKQYRIEVFGAVDPLQLEFYYRFHPVPYISIYNKVLFYQYVTSSASALPQPIVSSIYTSVLDNTNDYLDHKFSDFVISKPLKTFTQKYSPTSMFNDLNRSNKIYEDNNDNNSYNSINNSNNSNNSNSSINDNNLQIGRSIIMSTPSNFNIIHIFNNITYECDSKNSNYICFFSCYYSLSTHIYPMEESKKYKYCKFYIDLENRKIKIVSINKKEETGSILEFTIDELFSFYKVKLESREESREASLLSQDSFVIFDHIMRKHEKESNTTNTNTTNTNTTNNTNKNTQETKNDDNEPFTIKNEYILGFTNAMEQTSYLYLMNPTNKQSSLITSDRLMDLLEQLLPIRMKTINEPKYTNIMELDSKYNYPYRSICLYLCKHYGYDEREILLFVVYFLAVLITCLYILMRANFFGYVLCILSFAYGFIYGLPLSGNFINILGYITIFYCLIKYIIQTGLVLQLTNENGLFYLILATDKIFTEYVAASYQPLFVYGLFKLNVKSPLFSSLLWDGLFLFLLYTLKNLLSLIGLYKKPLHVRIRNYIKEHPKYSSMHISSQIKKATIWQRLYLSISKQFNGLSDYLCDLFPDLYTLFLKKYGYDSNHIYKQGKNKSIYSFMIQTVILIYIILFFSTMVSVSYFDVSEVIQQTYFDTNTVIMTIIHICTMVIDRYLYVKKDMEGKVIYQTVYSIVMFYFCFISVPMRVRTNFFNNIYLVLFFLLQLFYLLASCEQIRIGYPARLNHFYEIIENNYTALKRIIFLCYRMVPFIYLIHQVLDWIYTITSLDIWNWFELEDIRYQMFYSKSVMKAYDQCDYYKKGNKQTSCNKFIYGLSSFLALIVVLLVPIILFSKDLPLLQNNSLITGSTSLEIQYNGESFPFFVNTNNAIITTPSDEMFQTWQRLFVNSYNQTTLASSLKSQSQILFYPDYSESIWNPPYTVLNRLSTIMENCTNIYLSLDYTFTRADNNTTPSLSGSYKQLLTRTQCDAFKTLMDEDNMTNYIDIYNLYPRLYRTTSSSILVMDQNAEHYNSIRLRLEHLNENSNVFQFLWRVETYINKELTKNTSKSGLTYIYDFFDDVEDEYEDGLFFWVINEKVLPQIISAGLQSLGTLTIYAFYIYIVYTFSNIMSKLFLPTDAYLQLSSIEDASIILVLVHSVYIAREDSVNGNLYDEISLFKMLKRLYRSSELVYQLTRHKPNYLAIQYFSDVDNDENLDTYNNDDNHHNNNNHKRSYSGSSLYSMSTSNSSLNSSINISLDKSINSITNQYSPYYVHRTYNNDICPIDTNIKYTLLQQSFYPSVIVSKLDSNIMNNNNNNNNNVSKEDQPIITSPNVHSTSSTTVFPTVKETQDIDLDLSNQQEVFETSHVTSTRDPTISRDIYGHTVDDIYTSFFLTSSNLYSNQNSTNSQELNNMSQLLNTKQNISSNNHTNNEMNSSVSLFHHILSYSNYDDLNIPSYQNNQTNISIPETISDESPIDYDKDIDFDTTIHQYSYTSNQSLLRKRK